MTAAVLIAIRVTPRSDRDAIEGADAQGRLRVRVTAAPADGAANRAVIKLLAKGLGMPRSSVAIESGAGSRLKRLRIDGCDPPMLEARWPGVLVSAV